MFNRKWKVFLAIIVIATVAVFLLGRSKNKTPDAGTTKEIRPFHGSIQNVISTTGTVLPQNRLEIKPPINGRVESILVKEGQEVKIGQTLGWMSSTERAALLDAARGKGEDVLRYWEEAYKAIPLLAPIDGEVIVATVQPGQTVTSSDAVLVLSDKLIVRAQVDETDIGKIKVGQKAIVGLDAYPDVKIGAAVAHIYYESKTVNNVTIYEVDLAVDDEVPAFFRSGMNANIDFIEWTKDDALLLPIEAIHNEKGLSYVLLSRDNDKEPERRDIEVGISDDKNSEILSGITADDKVLVKSLAYSLPQKGKAASNPFTPFGRRRR